nr:MoaD/ThiS family protein [uncultured Cupriavidus sp.]
MRLFLKYFASIREAAGCSEEFIIAPESVRTMMDLRQFLIRRGGPMADALALHHPIRSAVNHVISTMDTPLSSNDEVALFPPVTGG